MASSMRGSTFRRRSLKGCAELSGSHEDALRPDEQREFLTWHVLSVLMIFFRGKESHQ